MRKYIIKKHISSVSRTYQALRLRLDDIEIIKHKVLAVEFARRSEANSVMVHVHVQVTSSD